MASFSRMLLAATTAIFTAEARANEAPGDLFITNSFSEWAAAASQLGVPFEVASGYGSSGVKAGAGELHYGLAEVFTIGKDWESWCCSYRGQIAYTGLYSTKRLLLVRGLSAVEFFVEPKSLGTESFSLIVGAKHLDFSAQGMAGAKFVGFVGSAPRGVQIVDKSGGSFAIGDFFFVQNMALPGMSDGTIANYGDIVSNQFSTTVIYQSCSPNPCVAQIDEALDDTTDDIIYSELAASGQNFQPGGPYVEPLNRELIPSVAVFAPTYFTVFASDWLVEPPIPTVPYDIPSPWVVFDTVRNSVYNTPAESSCTGVEKAVTIVTGTTCTNYSTRSGMLKTDFANQTYINGTGISLNYGILKAAAASFLPNCKGAPIGSSMFVEVSTVTGACGVTLSNSTVATNPLVGHKDPQPQPTDTMCGDNIIAVSEGANYYQKTTEDRCAACGDVAQNNGADFHIDNYTTQSGCIANKYPDLTMTWVVDSRGLSQ